MTTDDERDRERDRQDNGPGKVPVSSLLSSTALTAVSNLGKALCDVARKSRTGRLGKPLMKFVKDGGGTYGIGQRQIGVEAGSEWAINPYDIERGFIGFRGEGEPPMSIMASVFDPMPDPQPIIDKGLKPNEQWSIGMKCCSGADRGAEVTFVTTTEGGKDEVVRLVGIIGDRAKSGRYGDEISPRVVLERDGYKHPKQEIGWVATPLMRIVGWQSVDGPDTGPVTPEPEPPTSADDQPRRRRAS